MVFKRFVEVGRVIIINYGPLTGKLAVIVDILTTTKVIVQGLKGGVKRQELSLRRVTLTDYKIDIKRGAKRAEVLKAIEDFKLEEKFKKSNFAKKNEIRQKRANLTDFDRFKVMRLRQKRAVLRHLACKKKKGGKEGKKEGKKGEKKEKKK
jgi:large subunit ribosomal protein L14e